MINRFIFAFPFYLVAVGTAAAQSKEFVAARRAYEALTSPNEAQRIRYLTQLVRLRESLSHAHVDSADFEAIDAEIIKYPMPAPSGKEVLAKRLVGRWQSPRHAYLYRADGTWSWDEETFKKTTGTWRIEGNKIIRAFGHEPEEEWIVILLTEKDFVFDHAGSYYLRRGRVDPWH